MVKIQYKEWAKTDDDKEWIKNVERKACDLIKTKKYRPFKDFLPFNENDFRIYVRNFSDQFLIDCFKFINPLDMGSFIDNLLLYQKYHIMDEIYKRHQKAFLIIFTDMWFPLEDLLKCDLEIAHIMLSNKTPDSGLTPYFQDKLIKIKNILLIKNIFPLYLCKKISYYALLNI